MFTLPVFQKQKWYSPTHTGTYYLEADLYVNGGAKLSVDGSENDVDECETLFLASNSSTIVNLRAYGGDLDIRYTEIVSWDLHAEDFDRFPETNGRRWDCTQRKLDTTVEGAHIGH